MLVRNNVKEGKTIDKGERQAAISPRKPAKRTDFSKRKQADSKHRGTPTSTKDKDADNCIDDYFHTTAVVYIYIYIYSSQYGLDGIDHHGSYSSRT